MAEERVIELEDSLMEGIHSLSSREKSRLKNMSRASDMWDSIKCLTGITGIPEGEEKTNKAGKKFFLQTVSSSFLNSKPQW